MKISSKKLGYLIKGPLFLYFLICFCNNNSDQNILKESYRLVYIDNEGNCLPCLQMKKLVADVVKKRFSDEYDAGFINYEVISINNPEYKKLEKSCDVGPKSIFVQKYKNGKFTECQKVMSAPLYLFLNQPEKCLDHLEKEISGIINREKVSD